MRFGPSTAIGPDSSYFDATAKCVSSGDALYAPEDILQNAIIKAALGIWVRIKPWSSFVGDEGSYLPNGQTNFYIFSKELSILFYHCKSTTTSADMNLHLSPLHSSMIMVL